jgi:hypothetical protein
MSQRLKKGWGVLISSEVMGHLRFSRKLTLQAPPTLVIEAIFPDVLTTNTLLWGCIKNPAALAKVGSFVWT